MNTDLELLKQFFGGYFHEDWPLEIQTADEALTEYIAHSNPTKRLALSKAIQEYIDRYSNEDVLAENSFMSLGVTTIRLQTA